MTTFTESWIARLLYSTISATALLGNSLVIWVIVKQRKVCFTRPFDVLVFNLAVSDALAAVFIIFSRFVYVPPIPSIHTAAYLYCTLLWGGYILFALGYISIYTCLVLTFERWMAVVKPQAYRRYKTKHVLIVIVFIWIWGFILNMTVFFSTETESDLTKNEKCKPVDLRIGPGGAILPFLVILFTCLLQFTLIISLYFHIYYKINRMALFLRGTAGIAFKKRLTIIALVASSVLIVGWLPTQISYSLDLIGLTNGVHRESTLYNVFIMMTLINCPVNPILYGIISSRCRQEYLSALRGVFPCFRC